MAKKEFLFRGKTTQELQDVDDTEFAKLIGTNERRTLSRGYNHNAKETVEKILNSNKKVKTHSREIVITPKMVGKTISVYTGKSFEDIIIQEEMMGHRLGEFAFSTKRVRHGKAGVGATSGSAATTRK